MATATRLKTTRRFNPAKIRQLRDLTGLNYREFASRCGYTGQAIQQVEAGKSRPSVAFLERIAEVYGVDIRSFFDES
jgi:transcriptional regulator with XRE-family HTH domain